MQVGSTAQSSAFREESGKAEQVGSFATDWCFLDYFSNSCKHLPVIWGCTFEIHCT